MPIDACGVTASSPFDPESYDPETEPLADDSASDSTAARTALVESAPFIRFDHAVTRDAAGQLEGHAAVLSGHDAASGVDINVLSVAAEAGPRGARAGGVVERVGLSNAEGTRQIHADLLAASAELSTRNPDDSQGLALSAGAILVGVEATLPLGHANALTLGASLGVGVHASAGLRDIDHNGKPELCIRATEIVTIGACIELPF